MPYFQAVFVAEVFSRREIPSCDERYDQDEFGMARVVKRAPLTDVECGGGIRTNTANDGAHIVTSHNVTVTHEMAPSLNDIGNQPPQNQKL